MWTCPNLLLSFSGRSRHFENRGGRQTMYQPRCRLSKMQTMNYSAFNTRKSGLLNNSEPMGSSRPLSPHRIRHCCLSSIFGHYLALPYVLSSVWCVLRLYYVHATDNQFLIENSSMMWTIVTVHWTDGRLLISFCQAFDPTSECKPQTVMHGQQGCRNTPRRRKMCPGNPQWEGGAR